MLICPKTRLCVAVTAGALLCAEPAAAGSYIFTILDIPGSTQDVAEAINDHDVVLGQFNGVPGTAYIWSKGVVTELSASLGYSLLYSIDDRGIAIGLDAGTPDSGQLAVTYNTRDNSAQYGIILHANHRKYNFIPSAINESRMMVGTGTGDTPFLIGPKLLTILNPPGAAAKSVNAKVLNDAGMVAGSFTANSSKMSQGFTYKNGTYTVFNPPKSADTYIGAISQSGIVSGFYSDRKGARHGYTWDGTDYSVYDVPGALFTEVDAISSSGQVFGTYEDSSKVEHGFTYVGGAYHTLSYPGAGDVAISAANAAGTLVGFAVIGGVEHSFIATCPPRESPCTQ